MFNASIEQNPDIVSAKTYCTNHTPVLHSVLLSDRI